MSKQTDAPVQPLTLHDGRADRRTFFKWAGLGATALIVGCDSNHDQGFIPGENPPPPGPGPQAVTLDFSTDTGVLNYAYALEQLEAAYYAAVVGLPNFGSLFNADEQRLMRDLMAHEAIHRDFLAAALGDAKIPDLTLNMAALTPALASRQSILETALVFEDLGVGAYNGAGRYLSDDTFLTLAGKIVSVEARHASAIANTLSGNSASIGGTRGDGSPIIDGNGLDQALAPSDVVAAAGTYVQNTITVQNA